MHAFSIKKTVVHLSRPTVSDIASGRRRKSLVSVKYLPLLAALLHQLRGRGCAVGYVTAHPVVDERDDRAT